MALVPAPEPTLSEVLEDLAEEAEDLGGLDVDLVELRRATAYEYLARLYPTNGDEFYSFRFAFPLEVEE